MSSSSSKITVGIIGFGAFGRLLANALFPHVNLCIRDRKHAVATLENGVEYPCASLQEIAECRYVVLAVPVSEIGRVSRDLAPLLGAGTTVVDVGSVKVAPTEAMRAELPAHVDIIGTHPLFGPHSAPAGLAGLKVAICPVRGTGHRRLAAFLKTAFRLRTILTTAEAHDREAATVQGLTHLIAKVMLEMEPLPTRLTTVSYDHLMQAIRMVKDDAPNVREAIERVNPYTMVVRDEFFSKAAKVRAAFEP